MSNEHSEEFNNGVFLVLSQMVLLGFNDDQIVSVWRPMGFNDEEVLTALEHLGGEEENQWPNYVATLKSLWENEVNV